MAETPAIWMEARCGTVASITSDNWQGIAMPGCCQTAEGGFFRATRQARRYFERQGWRVIDDEWWCPCCAKLLTGG